MYRFIFYKIVCNVFVNVRHCIPGRATFTSGSSWYYRNSAIHRRLLKTRRLLEDLRYVVLLALHLCGATDVRSAPADADSVTDRADYLRELSRRVVAEVWQLPSITRISEVLECQVDNSYVADQWCLCSRGHLPANNFDSNYNNFFHSELLTRGTGIRELMRGKPAQCNHELLVVWDKVGRPPDELGVSKSTWCDQWRHQELKFGGCSAALSSLSLPFLLSLFAAAIPSTVVD